jgi:hypothetical protein
MIQVKSHKRSRKNGVTIVRKHARKKIPGSIKRGGDYSLIREPGGSTYLSHNTTYETSKNITDKKKIASLRKMKAAEFSATAAHHINKQL